MSCILRFIFFATLLLPLVAAAQSSSASSSTQVIVRTSESAAKSPLLIIVAALEHWETASAAVETGDANWYYLLAEYDSERMKSLADSLNTRLATLGNVDFSRVYLLFWGEPQLMKNLSDIKQSLIADQAMIDPTDSATPSQLFERQQQIFLRKSKWEIEVMRAKEDALNESRRKKPERFLAFGRTFQFLDYSGTDDPPGIYNIGNWNLQYGRGLSERLLFRADLGVGLGLPNPQKEVQSQLSDQLDFSALLNGNDIEAKIGLDLKGYVNIQLGVGVDYYLTKPTSVFRPYAGLGIGVGVTTLIEGRIDTTIVIEGGSFSPGSLGGGGFGGGDFDRESGDISPNIFASAQLRPRLGITYRPGQRIAFDLNLSRMQSLGGFGENGSLHSTQINLGMRYHFLGRRQRSYEYFHWNN